MPHEIYFGMPVSEHGRVARLEDAEGSEEMLAAMPEDLPMFKAGPIELMPTAELGNRADYLTADIPAGGKVSARAVARMYAALVGEVGGVRLISPDRLREVSAVAMTGVDEVFGMPSAWGWAMQSGTRGATRKTWPRYSVWQAPAAAMRVPTGRPGSRWRSPRTG